MEQRIVVIEDNPEFLGLAQRIANSQSSLKSTFFQSYEPTITYLQNNSVDGVITDLFFPAETNFRERMINEDNEIRTKLRLERPKLKLISVDLTPFRNLKENPSGLGIAKYCIDNEIPYLIVSQGDRHSGDLGVVREALNGGMPQLGIKKSELTGIPGYDKLPGMMLYGGSHIDKARENTWLDAFEEITNRARSKRT